MKRTVLKMVASVLALSMLLGTTCLAREFDASFYAKTYPDVVNALGSDATVLYNHYVTSGQSEGRIPYEGAAKGESVEAPNPNATVETPQPAAAKTYDIRDLKTLFKEQGWNWVDSYWLSYAQDLVNKTIDWPYSQINGRTTIDWWDNYHDLGNNCVAMRFAGTEPKLYMSLFFSVPLDRSNWGKADYSKTDYFSELHVYNWIDNEPYIVGGVKKVWSHSKTIFALRYNSDGSLSCGPDWAKK